MSMLAPTEFLDHDTVEVSDLLRRTLTSTASSPRQMAIQLYYAVRDGIRYEVYGADLSRAGLRASQVLRTGYGMCLHKSIVYAAALRSVGIPSRLVLSNVRNHLASPRLRELIGGDVFHYHCLTSLELDGRWMRATPVFNERLCRLYAMTPLEFDGTGDSVYHPFDQFGRTHMEFLHVHGEFSDLPYLQVVKGMRAAHPRMFADEVTMAAGSLAADANTPIQSTSTMESS
jgi:transglutaminase-like putative cysteine protease